MKIGNIPTMEKAHGVGTSTADVRLLGVGSRLGPMHDTARQSNLSQLTYSRHSEVAAPLSRLRRLKTYRGVT